jgi:uncharacterized protein (TIGR00266 family)
MEFDVRYSPSFSLLDVKMNAGEQVTAEAGAMIYMTEGVQIKTRTRSGGLLQKVKVSMLGGESFFVNDFVADRPCSVGLGAPPLGDIQRLEVKQGQGFVVQSSGYIASTSGVLLDTQWQGFAKGIFGTSLFMLKASGTGDLFVATFGAIDKHTLGPGQKITVDNFHLVAFGENCTYTVRKFGGLKSAILGGEGLVTEVTGPGDVYFQTKNPSEFAKWLAPHLPKEEEEQGGHKESGFKMGGFKIGSG